MIGDIVDTCDDLEFIVDARDQEGVSNSFWKRVRVVYVRDEATKFAIRLQV